MRHKNKRRKIISCKSANQAISKKENSKLTFDSLQELTKYIIPTFETDHIISITECIICFDLNLSCLIESVLNISQKENTQVVMNFGIEIESVEFHRDLSVSNIDFKNKFRVINTSFLNIEFIHCNFIQEKEDYFEIAKDVFWSNIRISNKCYWIECKFISIFNINSLQLEEKGEMKFENCSFHKKTSLDCLHISPKSEISFIDIELHDQFFFSDCRNYGHISFNGKICNTARLEINRMNSLFQNNEDITRLKMGRLEVISSIVEGTLLLYRVTLNKLSLEGTHIEGCEIIDKYLLYNDLCNKETAVQLKKIALNSSDSYLINKYRAEEFNYQLKEDVIDYLSKGARRLRNKELRKIETKINSSCWIKRQMKNIFFFVVYFIFAFTSKERFLLFLNKYSNDFGQNWLRGVEFTLVVAFIFYWLINYWGMQIPLFVIDWRFTNFDEVFKGYLNILNIISFNREIVDFKLTALGEGIFLLSKIFIAYGIYQTVSAFRKYGK